MVYGTAALVTRVRHSRLVDLVVEVPSPDVAMVGEETGHGGVRASFHPCSAPTLSRMPRRPAQMAPTATVMRLRRLDSCSAVMREAVGLMRSSDTLVT